MTEETEPSKTHPTDGRDEEEYLATKKQLREQEHRPSGD